MRLHLNVDCKVIARLGELLGSPEHAPAAARALGLLRPLVALLSQTDEQQRYMSSEAALAQICALAERLVDA